MSDNDPIDVSPIDLTLIRAMIQGGHIEYIGLLKLRIALTDEANVLGWHPSLFQTREALLALVNQTIEAQKARIHGYEWSGDDE